jgi:hypothetical protein
VTIRGTTAYWVIWNGSGLPQDGALRPHHRADARTFDVVNLAPRELPALDTVAPEVLPEARTGVEFNVPKVSQGRYPVVIYDGSEGGEHYTFDVFTVTRKDGGPWRALGGAAFAAAALLAAVYGARRWMSQPSPSRR